MWRTWRVLNLLIKTSGVIKLRIEQIHSEFNWHFESVRNLPGLSYFTLKNPHKTRTQKTSQTQKKTPKPNKKLVL